MNYRVRKGKLKYRIYPMARAGAVIGAALFLVLMASGCRYTAAPVDLLEPPSISQDGEKLVKTIQKSLSKYSKLMLPLRQETEEAIRMTDLDGDGKLEAVVSLYNESNEPQLLLFKEENGGWKQWMIIEQPLAKQMEWLSIQDLNGDGYAELLVGWIGSFETPNMLEIYSIQNKGVRNDAGRLALQPVQMFHYRYADIGRFNDEGQQMMAVISERAAGNAETIEREYELALYEWRDGAMRMKTMLDIDKNVNDYDRLVIGKISPRHYGIILEAPTGAHSMFTTLYKWENNKLTLVFPNAEKGEDGLTVSSVMNQDINGDGIIELHRLLETPGSSELSYADTVFINQWLQWNGRDQYSLIMEEYSHYRYGITMTIPESWRGHYSVRKAADETNGLVDFFLWRESEHEGVRLATLHAVPQLEWERVETQWRELDVRFKLLLRDSGNLYVLTFANEDLKGFSDDEAALFKEMLQTLEQYEGLLKPRRDY